VLKLIRLAVAVGLTIVPALAVAQSSPSDDEHHGHGPESIAACKDKSEGDACEFDAPRGHVAGTCHKTRTARSRARLDRTKRREAARNPPILPQGHLPRSRCSRWMADGASSCRPRRAKPSSAHPQRPGLDLRSVHEVRCERVQ
jgi:hypothetical protein